MHRRCNRVDRNGSGSCISGTVTDPSGSSLPGTQLTAIQSGRNLSFQATAGPDGRYVFARLPIGEYQIKAEATGFKLYIKSDLSLTTNADALLNVIMEIGAVTEQVTVSGEATRVSTESRPYSN